MVASIKASKEGLARVDGARKRKGWNARDFAWYDAANVSESTLKRFREGKAIQQDLFVAICKAVGIEDWETIVSESLPKVDLSEEKSKDNDSQACGEKVSNANVSPTYKPEDPEPRKDKNDMEINLFRDVQAGNNLTVKDAYEGLKTLFESKFEGNALGQESVDAKLEKIKQAMEFLKDSIKNAGADQDKKILTEAKDLIHFLQSTQENSFSKHIFDNQFQANNVTQQQGNNNEMNITFN